MTTTELIKLLQDNEKGGISHKSRQISLTVNGRYLPDPQITLSSTGDGIAGPEIDLDVDGEWFEHEADGTNKVLDQIRAEIEKQYGDCAICEYFEDFDYEENDISEYRAIGNISDILQIIDKYRGEEV